MTGLGSWFVTKSGRKFTRFCVGLAGASVIGFNLALHGPLQEKVRDLSQIYKQGKPKPLSDSAQELVKEVIKDSGLPKDQRKKIKFFNVIGLELFHSGDIRSPYGVSIGLPFYFEELGNINFGDVRIIGSDPIDWVIDGQDLLGALALSRKAKKFAIMREIHSASIWTCFDSAVGIAGAFWFGAAMSRKINQKQNLYEKPFTTRLKVYTLCFFAAYLIYRLVQDPTKHMTEKRGDRLAAATSSEYLEGGIEFYEKLLERNKALRVIMAAKGERMFDENGNENYFLISPRLPIRKRLEFLQEMKKDEKAESA